MDVLRDCLPKELITLIVSFMEYSTKFNMRTANRYWFSIVHLDEFKIHFANEKNLPEIVQHFAKHYANKPIGISLKKIVAPQFRDFPIYHLTALTQLTSLEVNFGFGMLRWVNDCTTLYRLTNLQRLPDMKVNGALANLTMLDIYETNELQYASLYTNLRRLKIQTYRTVADPFALLGNLSRLTSLELPLDRIELTEIGQNKLTQLNNLKVLIMHAGIQNLLPSYLKHLTSLEKLVSVEGAVHDDIFTLTRLTYLSLFINTLVNPNYGASHRSEIRLDIQKMSALCNLKYLGMFGNHKNLDDLTDLSFISHLTNLEDLQTYTNTVAVHAISNLNSNKLTRLQMTRLAADYVPDLKKLTKLLELHVSGTDAMFSPENDQIGLSLKNLTKLTISSSNNYSLDALENLKTLEIMFREPPKGFTLQKLTNLESLHFYHVTLPYATYNSLQYLTRLTYLEFSLTAEVFNSNPTALAKLPLKSLIFSKKIVTPELWSVLTQLRDLEHLEIWRVDSEEIIESFSVLTNLTHLTMKKMKIQRQVRGIHLTKLTSLQELTFRAHPRKYYARLPPDYLIQKGLTRLYKLSLH